MLCNDSSASFVQSVPFASGTLICDKCWSCRVVYSDELWSGLLTAAARNDSSNAANYITSIDYSGLLADAYALAQSRLAPISRFFELLSLLNDRTTALNGNGGKLTADQLAAADLEGYQRSGYQAARTLASLRSLLLSGREAGCAVLLDYFAFLHVADRPITALGATPQDTSAESWDRRLTRLHILRLMADVPQQMRGSRFNKALDDYMQGQKALAPDVREDIMKLAVGDGDVDSDQKAQILQLQFHYESAPDPAEKDRALYGLAYASSPGDMLQYAISGKVCTSAGFRFLSTTQQTNSA